MESDIEEPLQFVPFKRLHIGQVEQVHEHVRRKAGIKETLENMHLSPRAAELRWNKALREDNIEPEHDVYSEKVPPPAE